MIYILQWNKDLNCYENHYKINEIYQFDTKITNITFILQ